MQSPRRTLVTLQACIGLVLRHKALPGYAQLVWTERCALNLRALGLLLLSTEFCRVVLWGTAWLLASYDLLWVFDWQEATAAIPAALGLLWLLPWLAAIRRRTIAALLGNRWE